ncbi:MAG TPA: OsmC family protein [Deltaproteobacteria bacterium]|jgi:osmotically inducible protein OsmC|nr:OsmC family protein [Deltaproteobacteria bacterium]HOI08316.1 OsmC family protein [Deltaproteobacteria bacterium]
MKRKGSAVWKGGIKEGKGTLTTGSGALKDTPYSFGMRFGGEPGTNPEELIAAAHAGCASMALSLELGQSGFMAESIMTTATVSLEKAGEGFSITGVHLDIRAVVPGVDPMTFEKCANNVKTGCLVSRALSIPITMDARLEG